MPALVMKKKPTSEMACRDEQRGRVSFGRVSTSMPVTTTTHTTQVLNELFLSSRKVKLGVVESSKGGVVEVLLGELGARVSRDGDLGRHGCRRCSGGCKREQVTGGRARFAPSRP